MKYKTMSAVKTLFLKSILITFFCLLHIFCLFFILIKVWNICFMKLCWKTTYLHEHFLQASKIRAIWNDGKNHYLIPQVMRWKITKKKMLKNMLIFFIRHFFLFIIFKTLKKKHFMSFFCFQGKIFGGTCYNGLCFILNYHSLCCRWFLFVTNFTICTTCRVKENGY